MYRGTLKTGQGFKAHVGLHRRSCASSGKTVGSIERGRCYSSIREAVNDRPVERAAPSPNRADYWAFSAKIAHGTREW
jgi:hypothetical protein